MLFTMHSSASMVGHTALVAPGILGLCFDPLLELCFVFTSQAAVLPRYFAWSVRFELHASSARVVCC
jgi:hypothetical protein